MKVVYNHDVGGNGGSQAAQALPIEKLFNTLRIAVIFGNSKDTPGAVLYPTANLRHWKSYESVAEDIAAALRTIGFTQVQTMPDGVDLAQRLKQQDIHLAWLNTGGVQGQSPVCQTPALLETAGVPYVGHTPLNAALLDDKGAFKLALAGAGLATAEFLIWNGNRGALRPTEDENFKRVFGTYAGPFIVKPVNGRASQNVLFVDTVAEIEAAVDEVFTKTGCLILVERFVGGREYCIAVCGGTIARGGKVVSEVESFPFSAVERQLDPDEKVFTSMDKRTITQDRVRPLDPATEGDVIEGLNELARAVYNTFNLESLVRLDVRADSNGKLYILEANPKPDLARPSDKKVSIVCVGLPALGMTYEDLILSLLVDRLEQLQRWRPYALQHIMALV
jgi:D-alanine-D-alanine ligase